MTLDGALAIMFIGVVLIIIGVCIVLKEDNNV